MIDASKYFPAKTQHPEKHVRQVFGPTSDARLAQKIKTENPALYAELKQDAQALKIIDLDAHQKNILRNTPRAAMPQHVYTDEEAAALAEFSQADVDRFYRNSSGLERDNLTKLTKDDPAKAERLRLAATLRGVPLSERAPKPQPAKAPEAEKTTALPDELADFYGLPRGHQATNENYQVLVSNYAKITADRQAAKSSDEIAEQAAK